MELQLDLVRSVPGRTRKIVRPGDAIEYTDIWPTCLTSTLETKQIRGIYLAGQINGTSGYEEAAAQGLWAGATRRWQFTGGRPCTGQVRGVHGCHGRRPDPTRG